MVVVMVSATSLLSADQIITTVKASDITCIMAMISSVYEARTAILTVIMTVKQSKSCSDDKY